MQMVKGYIGWYGCRLQMIEVIGPFEFLLKIGSWA